MHMLQSEEHNGCKLTIFSDHLMNNRILSIVICQPTFRVTVAVSGVPTLYATSDLSSRVCGSEKRAAL